MEVQQMRLKKHKFIWDNKIQLNWQLSQAIYGRNQEIIAMNGRHTRSRFQITFCKHKEQSEDITVFFSTYQKIKKKDKHGRYTLLCL